MGVKSNQTRADQPVEDAGVNAILSPSTCRFDVAVHDREYLARVTVYHTTPTLSTHHIIPQLPNQHRSQKL